MADSLANDVIVRYDGLNSNRVGFRSIWRRVAEVCDPLSSFNDMSPSSKWDVERLAKIGNSRPVIALERSASAALSLLVPSGDMWHELKPIDDDLIDNKAVQQYTSAYRKRLFAYRYDSKAGFQAAIGPAYREMMAYGVPCIHVEEQFGSDAPFLYRYIPLEQIVFTVNAAGIEDTVYRKFPMTAKQMAQKFGEDRLAEPVKRVLNDPKQRGEKHFDIIHAVYPSTNDRTDFAFDDVYVDVDNKKVMREGGQYEMPYLFSSFGRVDPRLPYGYSPGMRALPDMKAAHHAKRLLMRAAEKNIDPPYAIHQDFEGVLNINAGAKNRGAINARGQQLVQPLAMGGNPGLGNEMFEMFTNEVNASLYLDLFAVFLNKPDTTATEALIRAQERADLLSPPFEQQEAMLGRLVAREISILNRKVENGEINLPAMPDVLRDNGGIDLEFTSPLSQLRRSRQASSNMQAINAVGQIAQYDPDVLDIVDFDEAAYEVGQSFGAAPSVWRDREAVQAIRQSRAMQQQAMQAQQQQAMQVEQAAKMAPVIETMTGGGQQ
ncbi:portal protein [Thalassospira povalilytica]|uniref:portal protein n=1 Tax=Thalassospira povalilytica TaxID=732237 RepID=UPI003AA97AFD